MYIGVNDPWNVSTIWSSLGTELSFSQKQSEGTSQHKTLCSEIFQSCSWPHKMGHLDWGFPNRTSHSDCADAVVDVCCPLAVWSSGATPHTAPDAVCNTSELSPVQTDSLWCVSWDELVIKSEKTHTHIVLLKIKENTGIMH